MTSPETPELHDQQEPVSCHFELSIIEMGVATAILSSLLALVIPAVREARQMHEPWSKPNWFEQLLITQPFVFPVVCTSVVLGCLLLVRRVLPVKYKKYVVWTQAQPRVKLEDLPKLNWDAPARVSSVLTCTGITMIVTGISHLRADRRQRRPIITWEGPFGPFAEVVLWSGCWAVVISLLIAVFSEVRCKSRYNQLASWFAILGFGGLLITFVIWCGATED